MIFREFAGSANVDHLIKGVQFGYRGGGQMDSTFRETRVNTSSLSDLKNRSENLAGRGQILTVLQVNSRSIDQKIGEIWTAQADLQPIAFKSGRLLGVHPLSLNAYNARSYWLS